MKVIAINGSPRVSGNTFEAISQVAAPLKSAGIEVEIIHVGHKLIHGCIGCAGCRSTENNLCTLTEDIVNQTALKMRKADGIILGSPVYYAGIAGTMKSFLDRVFYTSSAFFKNKVGAAVVAARRAGAVTAFQQLNNYLQLSSMVIAPSQYWAVIHGRDQGEAVQDGEGLQTARMLGSNMAWLLKLIGQGAESCPPPISEPRIYTSFIR